MLIVDDVQDIRDVLASTLSAEGWVVQVASSLLGALYVLEQNREIDCMLLDYNLPGMPMQDFLAQLKLNNPHMKIIMISAIDDLEGKAARYGIKHIVHKPFDFDHLRQVINTCCGLDPKN